VGIREANAFFNPPQLCHLDRSIAHSAMRSGETCFFLCRCSFSLTPQKPVILSEAARALCELRSRRTRHTAGQPQEIDPFNP
jgi:hypothetical protein